MRIKSVILMVISLILAVCLGLLSSYAVIVTDRVGFLGAKKAKEESIEESVAESISESEAEAESLNAADGPVQDAEATADAVGTVAPLESQLAEIHARMNNDVETGIKHDDDGLRIFIGDSRMVGLEQSVIGDPARDVFICKGATSYEYFRDEAEPALEELLESENVSAVYINMGVNDSANNCAGWTEYTVNNYVTDINQLVINNPGVFFYFMSVGETDGPYTGTRIIYPDQLNPYIDGFNLIMKEYCAATYIPVAEYIKKKGYKTADGVHYGTEVNRAIYDYVISFDE